MTTLFVTAVLLATAPAVVGTAGASAAPAGSVPTSGTQRAPGRASVLSGASPAGALAGDAGRLRAEAIAGPGASATASSPVAARGCVPPDPSTADTSTAAGWLGYLAAHRSDVGLLVDDGRSGVLRHRSWVPSPTASAVKVLHLAAYADAVDRGRLDPTQRVPVAAWEAWYLPGLDGGAHVQALGALGVPVRGGAAADPSTTVTLDDLVTAMIRFSDNAAADYLRDLLGDWALRWAARTVGWFRPALPSFLGSAILLLRPDAAHRDHRADAELQLAKRFSRDAAFRAGIRALPVPDLQTQQRWADRTSAASPAALTALHRRLSGRGGDPDRPGSALARQHLEWPPAPPGAIGLGAKGGSYPGIITEGLTLRRTDGTTASAMLMVRRMPSAEWSSALQSFAHQELLLAAMQDKAVLDRVGCALGARVSAR